MLREAAMQPSDVTYVAFGGPATAYARWRSASRSTP